MYLMLTLALLGADTSREIDIGQDRIIENGAITGEAREALVSALGSVANVTTATVIVCIGDPPLATAKQGAAAADALSKMVGEILPKIVRSAVARAIPKEQCPTGARLAVASIDLYGMVKEARVLAITGEVSVRTRDGRDTPLYKGSIVPEKGELVAKEGARATILLLDGTRVVVRESSRVALSSLQSAEGKGVSKIKLVVGTFWSRFSKLVGGNDLEVETPNAIAGVRGTDFQVDAVEKTGSLAVFHGTVGVTGGGGKKVDVPEGFAVITAKQMSDPRPLPPAPENLLPRYIKVKGGETRVRWDRVDKAVKYHFELARDIQFIDVLEQVDAIGTLLKVKAAPGKYFWRVMSKDSDGVESKPSKIYAIDFE